MVGRCAVGGDTGDIGHRLGDDAVERQCVVQADVRRRVDALRYVTRHFWSVLQVAEGIPILPQFRQIAPLHPACEVAPVESRLPRTDLIDVEASHPVPLFPELQIGHLFRFVQKTLQKYNFS